MRRARKDGASAGVRLRPPEFRLLRDLVNEHCGLSFEDDAAYVFDRRLGERVLALELAGYDEYYKYLRFDVRGKEELDTAVELLTTKETYLFRQEYQLRAFRDELLPVLHKLDAARRRLTVWSAGCSTGEEAYSIAILIRESGIFEGWDVRVIGSDLSRSALATARRGVYRPTSFRATDPERRHQWFQSRQDGEHVSERVKELCHFGQLNLLDAGRAAIVGKVDAIFCRNVLIYFDPRSRRRAIDIMYERLSPGGYLMLGHSESLLNVSTAFELVHLREDLVYRKPIAAGRLDGTSR